MAGVIQYIYDLIWSEYLWFPSEFTWADFKSNEPGIYYAQFRDVGIQSILMGFAMLAFRYFILERLFFIPLGQQCGLKVKTSSHYEENEILEKVYKKSRTIGSNTAMELSKKTSLSERQIQRWFRHRRNFDAPGKMRKFCECSWHFLFYTSILIYGTVMLWDKPWFWESKYCFVNWPRLHTTNGVYWYYLLEMGFYWSLIFSLLSDIKRKDFAVMTTHHVVTLTLTTMSWAMNFPRIGCLILFVHDLADMWMAGAKMAKYCNKQALCEALFGIFVVIWLVTRLFVYPYWTIYASVVEFRRYVKPYPIYNFLLSLLFVLQILHVMWTYMILRIAFQKFSDGEIHTDVRSESEGDEEESEQETEDKMKIMNNGCNGIDSYDQNKNQAQETLQNRTKRRA